MNRAANLGLLLFAFSRPISMLLGGASIPFIVDEATAGFAGQGRFRKDFAIRFYGPVAAAFVLFEVKKMAMRKFRF